MILAQAAVDVQPIRFGEYDLQVKLSALFRRFAQRLRKTQFHAGEIRRKVDPERLAPRLYEPVLRQQYMALPPRHPTGLFREGQVERALKRVGVKGAFETDIRKITGLAGHRDVYQYRRVKEGRHEIPAARDLVILQPQSAVNVGHRRPEAFDGQLAAGDFQSGAQPIAGSLQQRQCKLEGEVRGACARLQPLQVRTQVTGDHGRFPEIAKHVFQRTRG